MINIGIVGAGLVAETHVKALKELAADIRVLGICARRAQPLAAFCAKHDLRAFDDLDTLLRAPNLNVVLVLTPPNARTDIVRQAVQAGKHILMEKPIERTTEAAAEVVSMVEEAGLTLGVVFQHRFRAASLKLAELCRRGELGSLSTAQVAVPWWRPQSYYAVEGRGTYARDGGGVLISQAIHTLDLMQVFTGPVASVQCIAATTKLHSMEAEDFVAGGLEFASGAVGSLIATTASFPGDAESMVLDFEQASVRLQYGVLSVRHRDGRTEVFGQTSSTGGGADPMAFTHEWHKALLKDFAEAVATERQPAITGRSALETHRLIDALILSAREGRRISLTRFDGDQR